MSNMRRGSISVKAPILNYEWTSLKIMGFGSNNSYPMTLKNLVAESVSATNAVNTNSEYLIGDGFMDEKFNTYLVDSKGTKLTELHEAVCKDRALFSGYAIHVQYNRDGQAIAMTHIPFENTRLGALDDINYTNKIAVHYNFGGNSEIKKVGKVTPVAESDLLWFNKFDPNAVLDQIKHAESKGERYGGQVLWYSNKGSNRYPESRLSPAWNYIINDSEVAELWRRSMTVGFQDMMIFKTMKTEDNDIDDLVDELEYNRGSVNSNGVMIASGLSEAEMNQKVIETVSSGQSIQGYESTLKVNDEKIYQCYSIPQLLSGKLSNSVFTKNELAESQAVYNSMTAKDRKSITNNLEIVLENWIYDLGKIDLSVKEIGITIKEEI